MTDDDDHELARRAGSALTDTDAMVAVAESSTGGLVGSKFTNVPGASRFFERAAKIVDAAWLLAVGADFKFPQTTGPKPAWDRSSEPIPRSTEPQGPYRRGVGGGVRRFV
jgi:hypothetical protein